MRELVGLLVVAKRNVMKNGKSGEMELKKKIMGFILILENMGQ